MNRGLATCDVLMTLFCSEANVCCNYKNNQLLNRLAFLQLLIIPKLHSQSIIDQNTIEMSLPDNFHVLAMPLYWLLSVSPHGKPQSMLK
jgi:hypothetical protein